MARPSLADREPYDREQVVAAAIRVFKERGYDGATMLDIARALGIHKSSLYHHVAGKEQVLEAGLRHALDLLGGVLDDAERLDGAAIARLEHVVRRTVAITVDQLDEVTVLLRVRGNTAAERWAAQQRRLVDARVEALVRAAMSEGDLRPDLDAALVTRLLFGMTNSVTEWFQAGGALTAQRLADAVVSVCFDGLRAERTATG